MKKILFILFFVLFLLSSFTFFTNPALASTPGSSCSVAGAEQCVGNSAQTCSSSHLWGAINSCPSGFTCTSQGNTGPNGAAAVSCISNCYGTGGGFCHTGGTCGANAQPLSGYTCSTSSDPSSICCKTVQSTCNSSNCVSPNTCVGNTCTPPASTCNSSNCISPNTCVGNTCTPPTSNVCIDFFTYYRSLLTANGLCTTTSCTTDPQTAYNLLLAAGGMPLIQTAANQGIWGNPYTAGLVNQPGNPSAPPGGVFNKYTGSAVILDSDLNGGAFTYMAWRDGQLVANKNLGFDAANTDVTNMNIYYVGCPYGCGSGPVITGSIPGAAASCGGYISGGTSTPQLPPGSGGNPNPNPTVTSAPTSTPTLTPTITPTFTPTLTPSLTPTLTLTPIPTVVPSYSPTPTLTLTPTPVPTFTVTPTPLPGQTIFNLNLGLDGLGSTGDNANPANSSGSNKNPVHKSRDITLELFNAGAEKVYSKIGNIVYDSSSQRFLGTLESGNTLFNGAYTMKVTSPGYLTRLIPGIQNITSTASTNNIAVPNANLVTGDIVIDNKLNIQDYNVLLSCSIFSTDSSICTSGFRVLSNLDDNDEVNQFDINLFLREYSVQNGE